MNFLKNMFAKPYEDLNGADFKQKLKSAKQAVLLDVRTAGEFASGTIQGAKNLDFMSAGFAQQVDKLDKSKEYFVFCRSGNRSGKACEVMTAKGLKAYNLAGGIGAWN